MRGLTKKQSAKSDCLGILEVAAATTGAIVGVQLLSRDVAYEQEQDEAVHTESEEGHDRCVLVQFSNCQNNDESVNMQLRVKLRSRQTTESILDLVTKKISGDKWDQVESRRERRLPHFLSEAKGRLLLSDVKSVLNKIGVVSRSVIEDTRCPLKAFLGEPGLEEDITRFCKLFVREGFSEQEIFRMAQEAAPIMIDYYGQEIKGLISEASQSLGEQSSLQAYPPGSEEEALLRTLQRAKEELSNPEHPAFVRQIYFQSPGRMVACPEMMKALYRLTESEKAEETECPRARTSNSFSAAECCPCL